jgi:hypothetical protein
MLINPLSVFFQNSVLSLLRPFYFQSGRPLILGVLFLAMTREFLLKERVFDYNTPAMLQYDRPCTPREIKFRTYDGHCNNLNQTGMGRSNNRFGRSAVKDPQKPDPGLFEPDPYVVAEKLLKSPDGNRQTADPYNIFFLAWININIHDWVRTALAMPKCQANAPALSNRFITITIQRRTRIFSDGARRKPTRSNSGAPCMMPKALH